MESGSWIAKDGDVVHLRDPDVPENTGRYQLIEQPGMGVFLLRSLTSSVILGPQGQRELSQSLEYGLISLLSQDDLKDTPKPLPGSRTDHRARMTLRFLLEK